jgi:hypothetical protein
MANIFNLDNDSDFSEKISIDELYEKKRQTDLNQLALFQKILNRVHVRIKTTSKLQKDTKHCWFIVPETIIGVPRFDNASCIAYLLDKLQENGFSVRYFHPNTILIAWNHWVPSYVRNEIKKKTGLIIDEYGNKIEDKNTDEDSELEQITNNNTNANSNKVITKNGKTYKSVNAYKPTGNLVYNQDILSKLENKFT